MSHEGMRTYEAKHRILKTVDGKETWVVDRAPYFREYNIKRRELRKALRKQKHNLDPSTKAELTARVRAHQAKIADALGMPYGTVIKRRRKARAIAGPDRDARLEMYKALGVLTPKEQEYMSRRRPLARVKKEADNVRKAAEDALAVLRSD